jgi:predicted transcriptional regulator
MQNCVEAKRLERGLTRAQLAQELGTTYETVYRWEVYGMDMTNESLLKVAAFFQVRPAEIIPEFDIVHPSKDVSPYVHSKR